MSGARRTWRRSQVWRAPLACAAAASVVASPSGAQAAPSIVASGYDIASHPDALAGVLDIFVSAIGEPPSFFHLNDSEGALGSNRDRHMLVGEGQIGEAPFGWLLADKRSRNVPLILETPHANEDPAEDDDAPDPYDVQMMALLESLVQ